MMLDDDDVVRHRLGDVSFLVRGGRLFMNVSSFARVGWGLASASGSFVKLSRPLFGLDLVWRVFLGFG